MRTVGAEPERSNIYSSKKNKNKHIWPETHEKMGIVFGSRDAADALSLAITLVLIHNLKFSRNQRIRKRHN
jgi:hypothetical protein